MTEEECALNCTFQYSTADVIEGTGLNKNYRKNFFLFTRPKIINFFFLILANEENDENLCAYYDEEDCRFAYVYAYDEQGKVYVRAQKEKECPPQVYILGEEEKAAKILNLKIFGFEIFFIEIFRL